MTFRLLLLIPFLFIALLVAILLAGCNFNKVFLQPTRMTQNAKWVKMYSPRDTLLVTFSADTHQPTFFKNAKDTLPLDYEIKSVLFNGAGGNTLNGWWLKPKNSPPQITLIHFHGNAGCLMSQYRAMAPLVSKGFQLFLFDYSGFGFSQGKATRDNVLADGNAALTYVENSAEARNTRLIIYGQSLGGNLAAVVAHQREKEIDGLVLEGAFSSHKDIASHRIPLLGRILTKEKYSARKSIAMFHKPVLVIHSTEDKTVPFRMGKKLFDTAHPPKEFYVIQKPHLYGPNFYTDSIAVKMKRMLVKIN